MQFYYIPLDANGRPFSFPTVEMDNDEYSKIISEINSVYMVKYRGKSICAHTSFGIDGKCYKYWFENHGFDNYNIYQKVPDNY